MRSQLHVQLYANSMWQYEQIQTQMHQICNTHTGICTKYAQNAIAQTHTQLSQHYAVKKKAENMHVQHPYSAYTLHFADGIFQIGEAVYLLEFQGQDQGLGFSVNLLLRVQGLGFRVQDFQKTDFLLGFGVRVCCNFPFLFLKLMA